MKHTFNLDSGSRSIKASIKWLVVGEEHDAFNKS